MEVVKWVSDDVWYNWMYGRVALQWHIWFDDKSLGWGKVRVHNDPQKIPGKWHCNADVWVRDGTYMLVGYINRKEIKAPPGDEHKALHRYLRKELGLVEKK